MTPPNDETTSDDTGASYIEPVETTQEPPEVTETAPETTESTEEAVETPEVPAYEANFKYKVLHSEKEIPEKFRSLIKNAEDEKELKELFEAADGLKEHYKPKHEALQTAHNTLQSEYNFMLGSIEEAKSAYQRGDLDAFFDKLAIPPQKILQYAMEKLNYNELPPEQKALIDARRHAERQNVELQRQQGLQQRQYQQQVQNAHDQLLTSELARTDVKAAMDAYDTRMGKPGSFFQQVKERGELIWHQSGGRIVLTPSQAVEQVISLYGLKNAAPASASSQTTSPVSGGNQGKNNTIPNIGSGKSAAPLKKQIRSIDDLKKLSAELNAREA